MAFVMMREQTALCRCFGNPSVCVFFLPSICCYQSVNTVQFRKVAPLYESLSLLRFLVQPCRMVPHFALTKRTHKRKQLSGLESSFIRILKLLPVFAMCASKPCFSYEP